MHIRCNMLKVAVLLEIIRKFPLHWWIGPIGKSAFYQEWGPKFSPQNPYDERRDHNQWSVLWPMHMDSGHRNAVHISTHTHIHYTWIDKINKYKNDINIILINNLVIITYKFLITHTLSSQGRLLWVKWKLDERNKENRRNPINYIIQMQQLPLWAVTDKLAGSGKV